MAESLTGCRLALPIATTLAGQAWQDRYLGAIDLGSATSLCSYNFVRTCQQQRRCPWDSSQSTTGAGHAGRLPAWPLWLKWQRPAEM